MSQAATLESAQATPVTMSARCGPASASSAPKATPVSALVVTTNSLRESENRLRMASLGTTTQSLKVVPDGARNSESDMTSRRHASMPPSMPSKNADATRNAPHSSVASSRVRRSKALFTRWSFHKRRATV